MHLAAEPHLGVALGSNDAGLRGAERVQDLLGRIADGGHDPHPRDDDTSHDLGTPDEPAGCRGSDRGRHFGLEQADPQVLGLVDPTPIGFEPTVGDAEDQPAPEDPLDVDPVDDALDGRQDLVGELDLADAERPPLSREAEPTEVEAAEQPGITGSPLKWHWKNQRSGLISNSARSTPLPLAPPSSEISTTRSNISRGGRGSCALPGPKSSPRAQSRRSSYPKLERFSLMKPTAFFAATRIGTGL